MSCYNCIYYERDPEDGRRICLKGVHGVLYSGKVCEKYKEEDHGEGREAHE